MPAEDVLRNMVSEVGQNVQALINAPVGEPYVGPVLFEGIAGPQIVAEVLGPHLTVPRRPVGEPGRQMRFQPSELEGRIGSRILPDFLSVVDDPAQSDWKGEPLIGSYSIDEEGVIPKPLAVIEDGQLKNFLLTRQPVRGFEHSNGRARLPGAFGARTASISNLFMTSSENMRGPELKQKLLEMVQARNKPYGIIVRKMDFPSSAPPEELRRIMAANAGSSRPVSAPVLVYRVYANGKEELVRGLVFRGLNIRSLRDIVAVSADSSVLHYLNNLLPFALVGAAPYVAPSSVVAPSLLFDDLELARPDQDAPNLPLVPPPPLTAVNQ
jgi:predicted Zn-dependent protease